MPDNKIDNIKSLHIEYIIDPKELSQTFKHELDSKVYIDSKIDYHVLQTQVPKDNETAISRSIAINIIL